MVRFRTSTFNTPSRDVTHTTQYYDEKVYVRGTRKESTWSNEHG